MRRAGRVPARVRRLSPSTVVPMGIFDAPDPVVRRAQAGPPVDKATARIAARTWVAAAAHRPPPAEEPPVEPAIARELGRNPATVSRELRRNRDPASDQYRPFTAQRLAAERRAPSSRAASRINDQVGLSTVEHLSQGVVRCSAIGRLGEHEARKGTYRRP